MSLEILTVTLSGAVVAWLSNYVSEFILRFVKPKRSEETIETRVASLTESLTAATHIIGQIEEEIQTRSQIAEKLKKDLELYNNLKSLQASEIEAISQLLRGELQKEGKKSFWAGVAVNFFFFILGAAVSFFVTK